MNAKAASSPEASNSTNAEAAVAVYALVTALIRLAPRDFSLTSLSTLSTLARTGPRRVTDLAAVEGITQPSMTALVSGLQGEGYVRREADANDKRVARVALTESGLAYMRARRAAGADNLARLIDLLPSDEAATLAAAVPALTHLLELENSLRDPATPNSP